MKVAVIIHSTYNLFGESHWASYLRGNLTSSFYGRLERGRPFVESRPSFTRQTTASKLS